jgi:tetratricopeptide (TPR) repeat protein
VSVLLRRAIALNDGGDFIGAAAQARAGLQRVRPLLDVAMAVKLHSSLAAALIGQGEHATARVVAEQGLVQARASLDRVGECSLINVIGLIAMEQGDLTAAAEFFERSLVIAREIGNRGTEGLRLSNLGSVYPRLGHYSRARQHLDDALRVARATGRRDVEALVLLNTASVAHLQGDDAAALGYANAAFDAASSGGQRDLEAYARLVVGHAELGLGRCDAARAAYAASRDLLVQLKMRSQQTLDPVSGLVRVALAEGRTGEALSLAEAIIAHLGAGLSLDGTEEPLLIPLTAYRALAALGDARAAQVLAGAHAELQAQAARITDVPARQSFLQAVPHHREIVAAWGRANLTAAPSVSASPA